MPITPITLIIADAHAITRNGLAKTLEATAGIEVTAITGNSEEMLSLCHQHQPGVVMMGAGMPAINNTIARQCLSDGFPHIPLIIIVDDHDVATIMAMKTKGDVAWLHKSATEEEIIKTIVAVHEGNYTQELYNGYITNAVKAPLTQQLTPKEKEILPLFCLDLTAKEIAARKNLSTRTIEKHKEKIMSKLQVKGIAGLVIYAVNNNMYIAMLLYWVLFLFSTDVPDLMLPDAWA